jgi:hypothetical protein
MQRKLVHKQVNASEGRPAMSHEDSSAAVREQLLEEFLAGSLFPPQQAKPGVGLWSADGWHIGETTNQSWEEVFHNAREHGWEAPSSDFIEGRLNGEQAQGLSSAIFVWVRVDSPGGMMSKSMLAGNLQTKCKTGLIVDPCPPGGNVDLSYEDFIAFVLDRGPFSLPELRESTKQVRSDYLLSMWQVLRSESLELFEQRRTVHRDKFLEGIELGFYPSEFHTFRERVWELED